MANAATGNVYQLGEKTLDKVDQINRIISTFSR